MTRINKLTFPSHERDQLNKRSENLNLIAASCGLQQVESGIKVATLLKTGVQFIRNNLRST